MQLLWGLNELTYVKALPGTYLLNKLICVLLGTFSLGGTLQVLYKPNHKPIQGVRFKTLTH